jgi:GTP cyclohydrolase I
MPVDLRRAELAVATLLSALGVNEGDHTRDTPRRVARAWAEQLIGYGADPGAHLDRTFSAPDDAGLVIVGGIRLVSTCAHHLLPIVGVATVAYRPKNRQPVVGLSKLARVVDGYAKRLQVQERLGRQICQALDDGLDPEAAGCLITASHGCMSLRGISQPATVTTTHAWAGAWNVDPDHPDRRAVLDEHHRSTSGFKGGPVW